MGRCAVAAIALFASSGCQTVAQRPPSDLAYWSAPHDVRVTLSDSSKVELQEALVVRDSVVGTTYQRNDGLMAMLRGKRYSVGLDHVIRIESHETTMVGRVLDGAYLVVCALNTFIDPKRPNC